MLKLGHSVVYELQYQATSGRRGLRAGQLCNQVQKQVSFLGQIFQRPVISKTRYTTIYLFYVLVRKHLTIGNVRTSVRALIFDYFLIKKQNIIGRVPLFYQKFLDLTISFPKRRGAFSSPRPEHDLHEHGQA